MCNLLYSVITVIESINKQKGVKKVENQDKKL